MERQLRIAIIGSGNFTRKVHVPNIGSIPTIKVRACMDIVPDAARERAEQAGADYHTTDLSQVLGDPEVDAVMIATRADKHVSLCIEAAEAGKPIFCEKPMGQTLDECRELMDVLEKTSTPYMVGYCYRFNEAVQHVHPKVRPDFSPAQVLSRDNVSTYKGYINNLCHALDLLYYFHRSEPVEILTQGNRPWPCPLTETTGRMAINIHFQNGSFAVVAAGQNAGSAHLPKWYYKFCTSDGTTAEAVGYCRATLMPGEGGDFFDQDAYYSGHKKELELFAEALFDGKPMPVTAEDGFRVNLMMEAVRRSYESGQAVRIETLMGEPSL